MVRVALSSGAAGNPLRIDDLEVNELADGLVVYQDGADCVHYLNRTAALVFELSTGQSSAEEIAAVVGSAFGLAEAPLLAVRTCLDELREKGMIA
jgi:hypothetical protein